MFVMFVNVSHLTHALLVLLDNLDVLVHTLGGDLSTLALEADGADHVISALHSVLSDTVRHNPARDPGGLGLTAAAGVSELLLSISEPVCCMLVNDSLSVGQF